MSPSRRAPGARWTAARRRSSSSDWVISSAPASVRRCRRCGMRSTVAARERSSNTEETNAVMTPAWPAAISRHRAARRGRRRSPVRVTVQPPSPTIPTPSRSHTTASLMEAACASGGGAASATRGARPLSPAEPWEGNALPATGLADAAVDPHEPHDADDEEDEPDQPDEEADDDDDAGPGEVVEVEGFGDHDGAAGRWGYVAVEGVLAGFAGAEGHAGERGARTVGRPEVIRGDVDGAAVRRGDIAVHAVPAARLHEDRAFPVGLEVDGRAVADRVGLRHVGQAAETPERHERTDDEARDGRADHEQRADDDGGDRPAAPRWLLLSVATRGAIVRGAVVGRLAGLLAVGGRLARWGLLAVGLSRLAVRLPLVLAGIDATPVPGLVPPVGWRRARHGHLPYRVRTRVARSGLPGGAPVQHLPSWGETPGVARRGLCYPLLAQSLPGGRHTTSAPRLRRRMGRLPRGSSCTSPPASAAKTRCSRATSRCRAASSAPSRSSLRSRAMIRRIPARLMPSSWESCCTWRRRSMSSSE